MLEVESRATPVAPFIASLCSPSLPFDSIVVLHRIKQANVLHTTHFLVFDEHEIENELPF